MKLSILALSFIVLALPGSVKAQQKTADKTWWLVNAASWGATIADAENTMYGLKRSGVQELDPIFGHHPNRARMYGTYAGLELFQTYLSYKWKKQDDADRLAGRKLAKIRWYWVPAFNIGAHGAAIGISFALTGR